MGEAARCLQGIKPPRVEELASRELLITPSSGLTLMVHNVTSV